jgi:hypothetical protein
LAVSVCIIANIPSKSITFRQFICQNISVKIMHSAQEVGYNPQKSAKKSAPERSASGRMTVLWFDLTVFDGFGFAGNDFFFRV